MKAPIATVLGVACIALAWVFDPARFHVAWLGALSVWLGWPLGSLALLFVHALTGGRWGEALRPALLAGVAGLALLVPALVPLGLGFHALYPWSHEPHAAGRLYLTTPFAALRAVAYVVVWLGLGGLVFRRGIGTRLAAIGLILLALTVSFAAIDATMSLDPGFGSSVWGMVTAASMGVLALAVAVLATAPAAPPWVRADLGRLLLGLVVLWAYLEFMQFLIVWESNLPEEAGWYVARVQGGWVWVSWAVALLHFAVPFGLLIFPAVQRSARALCGVALLLVVAEIVRGWWVVLPAGGRLPAWTDGACLVGLALLSFAAARFSRPRAPAHA
jgi:hypothetical protein